MAQRAPRICGCGHKIAAGEACPCQVQRAREAERRRPTARQRGYSSKWERESKAFLALPENVLRGCACGCGRPATVVDHKRPHKGDLKLFWDRSNWQPMAKGCNSRKAVREEGGFGRRINGTLGLAVAANRDRQQPAEDTASSCGKPGWSC